MRPAASRITSRAPLVEAIAPSAPGNVARADAGISAIVAATAATARMRIGRSYPFQG
jgi:hypothetical protein